ncbi:unnamed protein product [Pleuronectes platessa]|uniref:Uncharacterized protein n=1 Tax=Pleuronectes platessa TaxID=8262 RepID=A0A9N7UME6_PLEPL|nr:unnamed protein product [Pleuronectes platessa]
MVTCPDSFPLQCLLGTAPSYYRDHEMGTKYHHRTSAHRQELPHHPVLKGVGWVLFHHAQISVSVWSAGSAADPSRVQRSNLCVC